MAAGNAGDAGDDGQGGSSLLPTHHVWMIMHDEWATVLSVLPYINGQRLLQRLCKTHQNSMLSPNSTSTL